MIIDLCCQTQKRLKYKEEKVMARFCTRCGKKLEDGEVCTCSQQSIPNQPLQTGSNPNQQAAARMGQQTDPNVNQQYRQPGPGMGQQAGPNMNQQYRQPGPGMGQQAGPNVNQQYRQVPPNVSQYQSYQRRAARMQGTDVKAEAKNIAAKALFMFKKPVTGARQFTNPGSIMGIELIAVKAVLSLILVILTTAILFGKVNKLAGGFLGDLGLKAPYFQLIVMTLFLTAGLDFLDALLLKLLSGSRKLNYNCMTINVSVRVVYEIFGTAIGGLFILLGAAMEAVVMMVIGLFVIAGFSIIPPYAQFAAYYVVVDNTENGKVFRYVLSKVIQAVAVFLLMAVLANTVVQDVVNMISSFGRYW